MQDTRQHTSFETDCEPVYLLVKWTEEHTTAKCNEVAMISAAKIDREIRVVNNTFIEKFREYNESAHAERENQANQRIADKTDLMAYLKDAAEKRDADKEKFNALLLAASDQREADKKEAGIERRWLAGLGITILIALFMNFYRMTPPAAPAPTPLQIIQAPATPFVPQPAIVNPQQ